MSPAASQPRDVVTLSTQRLRLTMPDPDAAPAVVTYLEANKRHLRRWSTTEPEGLYTAEFWRDQLARHRTEYREGRSLRLMISPIDEPERIIGTVGFSNFVRGAFQACHLGYAIAEVFQGRGMMFEAVRCAIDHAFTNEDLHRVMANYMPTNERSGALLRRLGFQVEGYARDYLYINGAWRDHLLTALTNPNPTPPVPA